MRNHLAHRYFDTAHSIVQATITHDLPPLVAAVTRLKPLYSRPTPLTVRSEQDSVRVTVLLNAYARRRGHITAHHR
jgi:hypothetical protein